MKVIDLLNKIAKGENVPKKIKYKNKIYTYKDKYKDYEMFDDYGCNWFINKIFDDFDNTLSTLNYEIEIIEEEKEMKETDFTYDNTIWETEYQTANDIEQKLINQNCI